MKRVGVSKGILAGELGVANMSCTYAAAARRVMVSGDGVAEAQISEVRGQESPRTAGQP